jgi:opacity protein-like surface antigen
MKLTRFVITATVVAALSGPAFAQEGRDAGSGQTVTTNPPVNQGVTNAPSANPRNWMASGFIGRNFGASRNNGAEFAALENINSSTSSTNFGGQVAYLGRGVIGGEFLADFSTGFSLNNVLFERSPDVNSYMFNLIAAAPFGHAKSYDPYVSGGIGEVTIHSTIFTVDPNLLAQGNAIGTETASGSRFGWDLGFGVMAYPERNWGFRGDVRYYRTTSDTTDVLDLNNIGNGAAFSRLELSGISYWKATAGLAFRW